MSKINDGRQGFGIGGGAAAGLIFGGAGNEAAACEAIGFRRPTTLFAVHQT